MSSKKLRAAGFHVPRLTKTKAREILDILQAMRPFKTESAPGYAERGYPADYIPERWRVVELTPGECSDFLSHCEQARISTEDWGMEIPEERIPEDGTVKFNLEHVHTIADETAVSRVRKSRTTTAPSR